MRHSAEPSNRCAILVDVKLLRGFVVKYLIVLIAMIKDDYLSVKMQTNSLQTGKTFKYHTLINRIDMNWNK